MPVTPKSPEPSPEQQAVIEGVVTFVKRYGRLGALHGAAGTGKTFTCGYIARRLLELFLEKSVFFISPTHAALRILRSKIPLGTKAATVARFLKTEPYRVFDEVEFEIPDESKYVKIAEEHRKNLFRDKGGNAEYNDNLRIVICDESSMISQPQADALRGICKELGVTFLMVGDPYQLPPVLPDQERRRLMSLLSTEELHDDIVYSKDMCREFRLPKVGFQLTEVHRNAGAILRAAVAIRNDFNSKHHSLPNRPDLDATGDDANRTGIYATNDYWDWVRNLAEAVRESENGLDVAAICHHNRTVLSLTNDLRSLMYPASYKTNWNAGEYVLLPTQTEQAPSFNWDNGVNAVDVKGWDYGNAFYSTTYCKVLKVETEEKNFYFGKWPVGDSTNYEFRLKGCFQRIVLKACHFYGPPRSIFRPVFTDGQPLADLKEAEKMVRLMQKNKTVPEKGDKGYADHPVGKILLCMQSFFRDINCANTMTVHKSQGCTLRVAFIHEDVADCKRHYRNSLLYTALTRASHQEVVFNSACLETALPRWEIGKHQLSLPPSERKPPKLSEQEIDDLLEF